MSARPDTLGETRLWLAQRFSAAVLAICVVIHLGGMILTVQAGLTAAEIIGRVGGHAGWFAFYVVFVLAAAIHAPIGLRTVLSEMMAIPKHHAGLLALVFGLFQVALGLKAVWGFYRLGGGA